MQFDKTPYHQTPGFLIRRLHQIHVAIFLEECAATAGVLRRLHARGLVRWRNAPHDLRAKFWRRTPAGDRLVKKMAAHASRSHERLVGSLTQSQLRSYLDVLRRLVDANNELGRAPLHLK